MNILKYLKMAPSVTKCGDTARQAGEVATVHIFDELCFFHPACPDILRPVRAWESFMRDNLTMGEAVFIGFEAGMAEAERRFRSCFDLFPLDAMDASLYALREISDISAHEAFRHFSIAAADAIPIERCATWKEAYYIAHARKARTRKKYRNRVRRRIERHALKQANADLKEAAAERKQYCKLRAAAAAQFEIRMDKMPPDSVLRLFSG